MRRLIIFAAALVAAVLALAWATGAFGWVAAEAAGFQRAFQNGMAGALRALKGGDPAAVGTLLALSFGYGVAHAAGPGHGKFLIAGYGVGRRVRLSRLALIALASSLGQALAAVLFVALAYAAFGWARESVTGLADRWLEPLSYMLIGCLGLWLLARGIRQLAAAGGKGTHHRDHHVTNREHFRAPGNGRADGHPEDRGAQGVGQDSDLQGHARHDHARHDHAGHDHAGNDHAGHDHHAHDHHAHDHHAHDHHGHLFGHAHLPTADQIEAAGSFREAAALVGSVAIRPCTGALFVLILTFAMGLPLAGIASAIAMGLGTAAITLAVAAASVTLREGALASLAGSRAVAVAMPVAEVAAGALVTAVAAVMLWPRL